MSNFYNHKTLPRGLNRWHLLVMVWISLYGFSFAQQKIWKQTNGPTGGRITAIASDFSEKIYCGTFGGNIFKFSGNGQYWEQIGLDITHNNITSIHIDHEGYIYFASAVDGIFRGSGKNKKWEMINNGIKNLEITAFAIFPDGTLFAGNKDGLYRSGNRGNNWVKAGAMGKPINIIKVHQHNIYTISNDNILSHSTDGGISWHQVMAFDNLSIRSLAIGLEGRVFAGAQTGEVFQSGNRNDDWQQLAQFDYGVWVLEVDSKGNIYAGLGGPAFRNEGGSIYSIPSNGAKPELIFNDNSNAILCIKIIRNKIYAGTNKGIYQSDENGTSWTPINSGLIAQRVHDLIINKQDEIFAGTYGGIFYSGDNGETWTEINHGLTNLAIVDMAINKNGDLFAGTVTSDLFRSMDNGKTWQKTNNGLPLQNIWISSFAINSQNVIFAATGRGIYRSTDNGDTWIPVNNGLEDSFYNSVVIGSDDVIYAGNEAGNVFHSDNLGDSWQRLSVSNPLHDAPADLAVDSENQLYFGSTEKGIFRYSRIEHEWIPLNKGLTNTTIRSLIINQQDILFAGTGVPGAMNYQKLSADNFYISTNKGKSWSLINSGLNHPRVRAIAINSKGIIFAGIAGGGVYKSLYTDPFR